MDLKINKETGGRESSIEMLRCISMFMILVLHANYQIQGFPTCYEISSSYLGATRCLLQSLSYGAVDIFLIISGYFSIKPSVKGITRFLSQVIFWVWIPYLIAVIFYGMPINKMLLSNLILGDNALWFVKAYLFLYVLAPVLNIFCQHAAKRMFQYVIVAFFGLQVIWGIITFGVPTLEGGYSPISFVGMYLLGRYLKLHFPIKAYKPRFYLLMYLGLSVFMAGLICVATLLGKEWVTNSILNYMSPGVIVASASLFMFFLGFKWKNRYVNWIASSCFAVYLLHSHPLIGRYFHLSGEYIWKNSIQFPVISILAFLAAVFIIAILLDKIREMLLLILFRIWKKGFGSKIKIGLAQ